MSTSNFASGRACIDCVIAIANDDYSGMDRDTAIRVRDAIARLNREGYSINVDTFDNEPHFSNSDCDVCQSRLAGDRAPVTFIW